MYSVYMHTCPDGKRYVGITALEVRDRWGRNGSRYKKQYFGRAIALFGWENIKHEVLFENLKKEEAERLEIELIKKYKSNEHEYGYNICAGGYTNRHTKETREKMSRTRKGRPVSEAHRAALSRSLTGKKVSEEHRRNESKSHMGYVMPQSQKDRISKSCTGKGIKAVRKLSLDGVYICSYPSMKEALRSVGVYKNSGNISSCCTGRRKNAFGFMWEYEQKVG